MAEPENALPRATLETLPETIAAACGRAGWTSLMPVQSLALPYLLEGRDIMVQSRTGSGKTGCYLLPLVPRLDPELHAAQALILVPTRELAVQVEHEARTLFEGTGIRPVAVYGGVGYKKQMDALRDGAQLVVGTPGRVLDHLLRRTLRWTIWTPWSSTKPTACCPSASTCRAAASTPACSRPPIRRTCSSWPGNS